MSNNIPEKLIAFNCYKDGTTLVGVVDVEFSGGQFESESLTGAGIAGTLDSPTLGHTQSITAKFKFRSRTRQSMALMAPKAHNLELRASKQFRQADGGIATEPERVVIQGIPKGGVPGGRYETGKAQDCDHEFEVSYLKVVVGGETVLEIDKLGFVYFVDGTDYLAGVRADLGMEG